MHGEPLTSEPIRSPETEASPSSAPAPLPSADASAVFGKNPPVRSIEQQSWGTAIAIVIIVAMVVVGAFYAWGKRVAEERAYPAAQGN